MKIIFVILSCILHAFSLVSCSNSMVDDTWDGTVAIEFAQGNGSQNSPFVIKTGAQLALMSEMINSGNYTDSYFVLENNIDLNSIEWTPIGNNAHPFNGSFDGNGHTITNLTMSNPIKHYQETYSEALAYSRKYTEGFEGLFGLCEAVTINNLNIKNATLTTNKSVDFDHLYMGILAGNITSKNNCNISNIKVLNSNINLTASESEKTNSSITSMFIGGVIGRIEAKSNLSEIHTEVLIEYKDGFKSTNCIGSVTGYIGGEIDVSDISSYLSVEFPDASKNYAGAFGYLSTKDTDIKLSNIFSEVKSNKDNIEPASHYSGPTYEINAIIGKTNILPNQTVTLEFENLFGYVTPSENSKDFSEARYSLYILPESINCIENNCQSLTLLPDNNGFNTQVWDITNKSKPLLK